jgi:hypothetical protein
MPPFSCLSVGPLPLCESHSLIRKRSVLGSKLGYAGRALRSNCSAKRLRLANNWQLVPAVFGWIKSHFDRQRGFCSAYRVESVTWLSTAFQTLSLAVTFLRGLDYGSRLLTTLTVTILTTLVSYAWSQGQYVAVTSSVLPLFSIVVSGQWGASRQTDF